MSREADPYGSAAVRSGIGAFLLGRGVSALLTFAAFALAARQLTLQEYGVYAAALALAELGLALATVGLDWVAFRILPEYRLHASGRATVRMVCTLSLMQAAAYCVCGACVFFTAEFIVALLQLEQAAAVVKMTGMLIAIDGVGRLARDQMLGIFMQQKAGQLAQIVRAGAMFSQLAVACIASAPLSAGDVMAFELLASAAALVVAWIALSIYLVRLLPVPARDPQWESPSRSAMQKLALHTYGNYLLALAYAPQMMTLLIARLLGPEAAGLYGFARTFADQVRRYLPTDLLQGVLRPALIAYYGKTQDFNESMLRLQLWFKSSLMVLLPLLAFFALAGDRGAALIGGASFAASWPVIVVMLCGAGMMAWRRVSECACNMVMASDLCVRASLSLLIVPFLVAATLWWLQQLIVAITIAVLAEAWFCLRILRGLRERGFSIDWQWSGFRRCVLALVATCLFLLPMAEQLTIPLLVVASALVSVVMLRLLKPLDSREAILVGNWSPRLARLAGY